MLLHRVRLAGHERLVHEQIARFQHAAVGAARGCIQKVSSVSRAAAGMGPAAHLLRPPHGALPTTTSAYDAAVPRGKSARAPCLPEREQVRPGFVRKVPLGQEAGKLPA